MSAVAAAPAPAPSAPSLFTQARWAVSDSLMIAKRNLRIYEVPISYYGRTYAEGKKIGWKDGVRAIYCIFKYGTRRAPR